MRKKRGVNPPQNTPYAPKTSAAVLVVMRMHARRVKRDKPRRNHHRGFAAPPPCLCGSACLPDAPLMLPEGSLRSPYSPRRGSECAPSARRKRAFGASATRRLPPPLRGAPERYRTPRRTPITITLQRSQTGLRALSIVLAKSSRG